MPPRLAKRSRQRTDTAADIPVSEGKRPRRSPVSSSIDKNARTISDGDIPGTDFVCIDDENPEKEAPSAEGLPDRTAEDADDPDEKAVEEDDIVEISHEEGKDTLEHSKQHSAVAPGKGDDQDSGAESEHDSTCNVCHEGGELLCCDTCTLAFHLECLKPPLEEIPDGDWFCPICVKELEEERRRKSGGREKKDPWTPVERTKLKKGLKSHGEDWVSIAALVRTRSADDCKQYFSKNRTSLKKCLDMAPKTRRPTDSDKISEDAASTDKAEDSGSALVSDSEDESSSQSNSDGAGATSKKRRAAANKKAPKPKRKTKPAPERSVKTRGKVSRFKLKASESDSVSEEPTDDDDNVTKKRKGPGRVKGKGRGRAKPVKKKDDDDEEAGEEDEKEGASDGGSDRDSMHDAICDVCEEYGFLVCCDECPLAYHLECLGMVAVPEGHWLCPACRGPEGCVEQILWKRTRPATTTARASPLAGATDAPPAEKVPEPSDTDAGGNIVEYYVKWKGKSYRECSWIPEQTLEKSSSFRKRHFDRNFDPELQEIEDANFQFGVKQDWLDVDRVISQRKGRGGAEYLVKWRDLPYQQATWEKESDIAESAIEIERFKQREEPPKKDKNRRKRGDFDPYEEQPACLVGGKLHPYQLEGLNWLLYSWHNKTNVILADEMGLGKTVQTIAFMACLLECTKARPFLIVVPLSTLTNWEREFRTWTPHINAVFYYGSQENRKMIQEHEFFRPSDGKSQEILHSKNQKSSLHYRLKLDVVATSYELAMMDASFLKKVPYAGLIVDEGHRLKNQGSKLFQILRNYDTKHRLLLTGTPLQNNLEELFNLLTFLDPSEFDSLQDFDKEFRVLDGQLKVEKLHKKLQPRLLRRMKKDVMGCLPPKEEYIVRVELGALQQEYYRAVLAKNFQVLNKNACGKRVSLLNVLMELRKCCNHALLFESADNDARAAAAARPDHDQAMLEKILSGSGKLELLDRMLKRLKAAGHRVLIYSQWSRMLDVLEEYMRLRGYVFERLDGSIAATQRQLSIDRFNAAGSNVFCFLLTTRAGGIGINLATADTVIIFDSDWNPHNDLQALARAHRIGQQNKVMIYRLVSRGTVEEQMIQRAKNKLVLDLLVVKKMNAKGQTMLKEGELDEILRFGSEAIFDQEGAGSGANDDTGKAASKRIHYDDEAIDRLLDRTQQSLEQKSQEQDDYLGSFRVAKFWTSKDDGKDKDAGADAVGVDEEQSAPKGRKKKDAYWEFLRDDFIKLQEHDNLVMGKGMRHRKQVQYRDAPDIDVSDGDEDKAKEEDPTLDHASSSSESGDDQQQDGADPNKVVKRHRSRRPKDAATPSEAVPLPPLLQGDPEKGFTVFGFNQQQRTTFLALFMRFGHDNGTWERLFKHRAGKIRSKRFEEIRVYGDLLMVHLAEEPNDKPVYADGVPKEMNTIRLRDVLARLAVLELFAAKLAEWDSGQRDTSIFKVPQYQRSTPNLWTPEHDIALLRGISIHGFDRPFDIVNDPSLNLRPLLWMFGVMIHPKPGTQTPNPQPTDPATAAPTPATDPSTSASPTNPNPAATPSPTAGTPSSNPNAASARVPGQPAGSVPGPGAPPAPSDGSAMMDKLAVWERTINEYIKNFVRKRIKLMEVVLFDEHLQRNYKVKTPKAEPPPPPGETGAPRQPQPQKPGASQPAVFLNRRKHQQPHHRPIFPAPTGNPFIPSTTTTTTPTPNPSTHFNTPHQHKSAPQPAASSSLGGPKPMSKPPTPLSLFSTLKQQAALLHGSHPSSNSMPQQTGGVDPTEMSLRSQISKAWADIELMVRGIHPTALSAYSGNKRSGTVFRSELRDLHSLLDNLQACVHKYNWGR